LLRRRTGEHDALNVRPLATPITKIRL